VRPGLTQKVRLNKDEKVISDNAFSAALSGQSRIWLESRSGSLDAFGKVFLRMNFSPFMGLTF
jgi:hypothetical protein